MQTTSSPRLGFHDGIFNRYDYKHIKLVIVIYILYFFILDNFLWIYWLYPTKTNFHIISIQQSFFMRCMESFISTSKYKLKKINLFPSYKVLKQICQLININLHHLISLTFKIYNLLTPKSDKHLISPYNITPESKERSWIWRKLSQNQEALDC